MPTPKSKLSKFILSLPVTLSGAQVVAHAKSKGLKTSRANVSRVRSLYGSKAVTPSTRVTTTVSKTAPANSAAPETSKTTLNKSDFIRAQPATMSPADVVAKGNAEGVKFGRSLVYMVRGAAMARKGVAKPLAAKATASTTVTAKGPAPSSKWPATTSSVEDLLCAVAAELGLGRAVEILAGERARVQSILKA
jgi:hypothetical protein